MSHNYEQSDREPSLYELDEQLQQYLSGLLHQSLELVELAKSPESTTIRIDNAPFGNFMDSNLSLSLTHRGGNYEEGYVSFDHSDDPERNFSLHNTSYTPNALRRVLWLNRDPAGNGKPLLSVALLRRLHRNWPIEDSDYPSLEQMLAIPSSGKRLDTSVMPVDVLSLLDAYLAGRHPETLTYDTQWCHVFDPYSDAGDVASIELRKQRRETSLRSHLSAEMRVVKPGEPMTDITYIITSDELDNVTISAQHRSSTEQQPYNPEPYHEDASTIDTELLAARLESALGGLTSDLT